MLEKTREVVLLWIFFFFHLLMIRGLMDLEDRLSSQPPPPKLYQSSKDEGNDITAMTEFQGKLPCSSKATLGNDFVMSNVHSDFSLNPSEPPKLPRLALPAAESLCFSSGDA